MIYYLLEDEELDFVMGTITTQKFLESETTRVNNRFSFDQLPKDDETCREALLHLLEMVRCDMDRKAIIALVTKKDIRNMPLARFFSSTKVFRRFLYECKHEGLIKNDFADVNIHNITSITICEGKNTKILFLRKIKHFMIDHQENAIKSFDIKMLRRLISLGVHIKCDNTNSLRTDLYRI